MDFKIFLSTFGAILLAELADKTQLVGMGMAVKTGKPVAVWLGSISAFVVITGISVLAGTTVGKHLRPEAIKYLGGSLFVIIGILMLLDKV